MALYAIADTHLSQSSGKPMTVFGPRWSDWTQKLCRNWTDKVRESDTVVIAGDISWAMTADEALEDLKLLDRLPGTKIIGKGNHDYWWGTVKKTEDFMRKNGICTIKLLYNNSIPAENAVICGCRGWYTDKKTAPENADYGKIMAREAARLERSLKHAEENYPELDKKVFFHFPPVFGDFVGEEFVDILLRYGIDRIFFGHIHGKYDIPPETEYKGIRMKIISSDYLEFSPLRIDGVNS